MDMAEYFSNFGKLEIALILANLLLLAFSRPVLEWIYPVHSREEGHAIRLGIFRGASVLVLVYVLVNGITHPIAEDPWLIRMLAVLLIGYTAIIVFWFVRYRIQKRFGKLKKVNDKDAYAVTYNSRILSMGAGIVITILALVTMIQTMGFNSWLQAGGILGVIGVMLAMTQAAWVPDLISGLVIMNSRLVEEGDVVQVGTGEEIILGVVFRTKIFYTEILHLVNNHRIMIQNSRLRSLTVHNLSRFASAKGLRESIVIKVSYAVKEDQVRKLFEAVMEQATEDASIPVESQHEPEVRATRGGDFAVEWTCYYYIKEARHLLRTRQLIFSLVLQMAREQDIDLATPDLLQNAAGENPVLFGTLEEE